MWARIHGGGRQVGGSCVELEHRGNRLVLDLGCPLGDTHDAKPSRLPQIPGIVHGDNPLLWGIVVSHGHPDHYGLVPAASGAVPRFIGESAHRILKEAAFFSPTGVDLKTTGFLHDRETLTLGPFCVTPYLVDHSAFDAYALHVEAGGRRLFYSGDIRAHGRKKSLFERLVREPPPTDVLLLEGTRIGESAGAERGLASERAVEERAVDVFRGTDGMALVMYSAQNIDRVVSLYRAATRANRLFVLDLYGASVATATGRRTIPQASWDGVRVFVPFAQRIRVKRAAAFERTAQIRTARVYPDELAEIAERVVLSFRASMADELLNAACLRGATALWSLWSGYLDRPDGTQLRAWLDEHQIPLTLAHASGHARADDLARLVQAMAGARIVPIHTPAPPEFRRRFPSSCVELPAEGEWWPV